MGYHPSGAEILPSDDPLCHLGIHPQNNCLCRSGSQEAQDIGPFTAWGTWEGGGHIPWASVAPLDHGGK